MSDLLSLIDKVWAWADRRDHIDAILKGWRFSIAILGVETGRAAFVGVDVAAASVLGFGVGHWNCCGDGEAGRQGSY